MLQRDRKQDIVSQLELSLQRYRETHDPKQLIDILNTAKRNGLTYDVDTLDSLLDQFHHIRGAAIAIYDELYPPPPEEARQLRKARRIMIKESGIIT